jgi:hypothetical protein
MQIRKKNSHTGEGEYGAYLGAAIEVGRREWCNTCSGFEKPVLGHWEGSGGGYF